MAIRKQGEEHDIQGSNGQTIDIYNGDWEALKNITQKWGLKDETSALRFALAVLTLAETDGLSVNGVTTTPAESLLRNKDGHEK